MRGFNEDELPNFVEFTRDKDIDIRFIEYMPFEGNKWVDKKMVPYQEMLNIIKNNYSNLQRIEDSANDTSKVKKIDKKFSFVIIKLIFLVYFEGVQSAWILWENRVYYIHVGSFLWFL